MSDPVEEAREARKRGDLFGAYDIAARAIADGNPSEDLKYEQALAMARMGDTERALSLYTSHGLDCSNDPHKRALGARLLKDRGVETSSQAELANAFFAYRRLFTESESKDSYFGINAASLALLTGQAEEARQLASDILDLPKVAQPTDYYCGATRGEALLILGDVAAATEALRQAVDLPGANFGDQAGTLRQLRLVAEAAGVSDADREALLDAIRPPSSFHYVGHIFMADEATER